MVRGLPGVAISRHNEIEDEQKILSLLPSDLHSLTALALKQLEVS